MKSHFNSKYFLCENRVCPPTPSRRDSLRGRWTSECIIYNRDGVSRGFADPMKNLAVIKKIGGGGSGQVYVVMDNLEASEAWVEMYDAVICVINEKFALAVSENICDMQKTSHLKMLGWGMDFLEYFNDPRIFGTADFYHGYYVTQHGETCESRFSAADVTPAKILEFERIGFTCVKISYSPFKSEADRKNSLREVEILYELSENPNIVSLLSSWEIEGVLHLQMEYCSIGSLRSLLNTIFYKNIKKMRYKVLCHMMKDISNALCFLKEKEIIHCDIKPENIFVNSEISFKLGDFGISRKIDEKRSEDGDKKYMPLEALNEKFGYYTDIFSLGLIYIEIALAVVLPSSTQWIDSREIKYLGIKEDEIEDPIVLKMIEKNYKKRIEIEKIKKYFMCKV